MIDIIDSRLREVEENEYGYVARYRHLNVMVTEFIENDGKKWRHASVSRRNQKEIPTYEDLLLLKDICIGKHRTAYQVFPPDEQFVHGHKGVEVLHLWCCLDGDVTPDFRKETPFGTLEI